MKDKEFREWLENTLPSRNSHVISDYISRCARIERALKIDLDDEFYSDGGKKLLENITYPADKILNGEHVYEKFDFANLESVALRNSLASLCSAARSYFSFMRTSV